MSNQKYTPPKYGGKAFHCPHPNCGVYARQYWTIEFNSFSHRSSGPLSFYSFEKTSDRSEKAHFRFSLCESCENHSVWANEHLIYPQRNTAPPPNENMSREIIDLYQEAADVVRYSPRASAALLRVALEHLCDEHGGKGRTLAEKAQYLANEKKLSPDVSEMMELIFKTGNKAAHPAEIDFNENPQIAEWLFELINYVAEEMIAAPARRKKVSENINRILESAKKPEEK